MSSLARTRSLRAPVLVGFDGSDSSRLALAWALDEARGRNLPLRLVHVFASPLQDVYLGAGHAPLGHVDEAIRLRAAEWFEDEVRRVATGAPGVEVSGELADGSPGAVLVDRSRGAELVVLGSRGLGGFTGLLLGSVSDQVSAHAPCTVVVHRHEPAPPPSGKGYVVVGVDGSAVSDAAVRFAFEEASRRGLELRAVLAWLRPVATATGNMLPLVLDPDVVEGDERAALAEALAGYRDKYPDVAVHQLVTRDAAPPALVLAAEHASLLVVGNRGRGGFGSLVLGSTSRIVLHHAPCPVAVAR